MAGVHETAGVQLGLLPVAIAASSLFPLLKSFLQRGVNLGEGEGITHVFTERMEHRGTGDPLPYITVTLQYQYPIQKMRLNVPRSF